MDEWMEGWRGEEERERETHVSHTNIAQLSTAQDTEQPLRVPLGGGAFPSHRI